VARSRTPIRPSASGTNLDGETVMSDRRGMQIQGMRGPGAFQWGRAGGFGGPIGATLWLHVLGGRSFVHSSSLGAAILMLGILPNVVGVILWRKRNVVPPYPALQILVASTGLCVLAAICTVAAFGLDPPSVGLPLWAPLVFVGIMLAFHVRERGARGAAG